jgi:hypothetical protein
MVDLTLKTAVTLILTVAVFLLLFTLATTMFSQSAPKAFSEAECRMSNEIRTHADLGIFDFGGSISSNCGTKTINLVYDKDGKKKDKDLTTTSPTYYIAGGKMGENKLKSIFAEHQALCLWQMLDGKKSVFGPTGETRCAICYDLILDKAIVDPKQGNIQKLTNYDSFLESNKFSKTNDYYNSYFNDFYETVCPGKRRATTYYYDIKIADDSGKPVSYSIIYSSIKNSKLKSALESAGVAAGVTIYGCLDFPIAGCFVGAFAGGYFGAMTFCNSANDVRSLAIVPIYELGGKCEALY